MNLPWTHAGMPALALILLLSGLALAPVLFIRTLTLALLVMGLAGLAAAPYYVVEQSITQRLVPEQVRGQIFGSPSLGPTSLTCDGSVSRRFTFVMFA